MMNTIIIVFHFIKVVFHAEALSSQSSKLFN